MPDIERSFYSEACDLEDKLTAANAEAARLREALRPFVEAYDAVDRTFCPTFDGPLDLEAFERAARVLNA